MQQLGQSAFAARRAYGGSTSGRCWQRSATTRLSPAGNACAARPFLLPRIDAEELERVAPGECERVQAGAARVADRTLDLGEGPSSA